MPIPISLASLQVGFYQQTCPLAEAIVRNAVNKAVSQNPRLGAGLIMLHFHDCFVRGCDASVLLDSTPGSPSEKENAANSGSLQGFEVIEVAKAEIEAACPQTVSCSDILAFAAHEPTGNLPTPFFNVQQLQDNFPKKGLSLEDMVTLFGAHSIGISHCSSFSNRLYSFNAMSPQDPSMDPKFASDLKTKCPSPTNDPNRIVALDVLTPNRLDNKYYQNLQNSRWLLTSTIICILHVYAPTMKLGI
ncbi:hypothetical protein Ancab_000542 [Ancistrocladus abbreviatus]